MVDFNPGVALTMFVAVSMLATWAKGAGGPFRILVIAMVGIPVLLTFVVTYGTSAPASAIAAVLGAIVGLKT